MNIHQSDNQDDESGDSLYDRPSKSQVKRELLALVDLGKQVIELPIEKIKKLPLDDKLFEAVKEAKRISNSREGKRRQTHYVGKLMRQADEAAIRKQLDIWENGSKALTAHMHRLETLRDRLIDDDDELTRLLNNHPECDIQAFRALIRAARKEAKQNETLSKDQEPAKKHYRALFQAIKSLLGSTDE